MTRPTPPARTLADTVTETVVAVGVAVLGHHRVRRLVRHPAGPGRRRGGVPRLAGADRAVVLRLA